MAKNLKVGAVLILLYVAVIFNFTWLWGVLFLYWAGNSILLRHVFFVEDISRDENQPLFWTVIGSLVLIGVYFAAYISPDFETYMYGFYGY